jgi:aspartyl-tRNA(Asn)/glutamyl-tRNA(Gln) amidotransferase subunit B
VFARKNYFYPDLPKGYQISQYEIPIVAGGTLTIHTGTGADVKEKTIRLTRAHLEEDAGKSLHEDYHGMTGIDLNRAGTPLLEIVSEPDLRSADEAIAYAKQLHELVQWHGICDGNMQEGSFRCDANVSVRPEGQEELGTRCEIKNLNSFRFMEKAIEYEVRRQIALIEDGGRVVQETRLYDPDRNETRPMRSKEDAMDYRYFPDPDLPPLIVDDAWIERVKSVMPETQDAKKSRFMSEYGLPAYDARLMSSSRALADYFEAVVMAVSTSSAASAAAAPGATSATALDAPAAKAASNWLLGEMSAALNDHNLDIAKSPVRPPMLARLIAMTQGGTLSSKMAKDVFAAMWTGDEGGDPERIAKARGLEQISDSGALETIIDSVLAANVQQVADYRNGREKAFNSLVGQVMKATKGSANPGQVNALLKDKLK